jgi:hypothetical protein
MMLKTTFSHIALGAALLAANACTLQKEDDVSEYRDALPQATSVRVAGPEQGAASTTQALSAQRGLLGAGDGAGTSAVAKYYSFTRNVRDGVNVVTRDVLGSVWLIVHTRPTSIGTDYAEWGPYTDALEPATWRFRVEKAADGAYDYSLAGRPRASRDDADYLVVLSGKGYARTDERHGDGSFIVDLDAAKALDPAKHVGDSGTVTITHDLPRTISIELGALPRTISADIRPAGEAWTKIVSLADTDGTGTLDVDAHADVDASKATALEDVSVQSRWRATGAGRADVSMAGGDLPATVPMVSAVECWGTDFTRVYYSDSVEFEPTAGDPKACAYDAP